MLLEDLESLSMPVNSMSSSPLSLANPFLSLSFGVLLFLEKEDRKDPPPRSVVSKTNPQVFMHTKHLPEVVCVSLGDKRRGHRKERSLPMNKAIH